MDAFLWKKAAFLSQHGVFFGEGYEQFHRVNVACPRVYLEKALLRLEDAMRTEGLL